MDVWTCFHLYLVDTSGVGGCMCVSEYDVVIETHWAT